VSRVYGGRRAPDRYRRVRRAMRRVVGGWLPREDWDRALAARRVVGAHRWPKLAAKLEVS